MNRFSASGFHFLFSLLVGLLLLALCWFVWYPAPMLTAIGGHEIFLLVVGIDVVLGPLLTLVAFKSGKKGMKCDLAIIAFMQIGALAYGVSTLLEGRPAYVAALGDHFQVIQASEITDRNLKTANAQLPWWGPIWVGTKEPTEKKDISLVDAMRSVGGSRGHLPKLHIPYTSMKTEILENAQPISKLLDANPKKKTEILSWLKNHQLDESKIRFQAIQIGSSIYPIILENKTVKIVGIMALNLQVPHK